MNLNERIDQVIDSLIQAKIDLMTAIDILLEMPGTYAQLWVNQLKSELALRGL